MASHSSMDCPDEGACRMGTPSAASADASHSSPSSPPAAPDGARAGHRAARRQHGRDQDVHVAFGEELEDGPRRVAPQRVAPDGHHLGAPRLDLVAQVGDELGVPGHEVRPVEDEPDAGSVRAPLALPPHAVGGDLHGRTEAEALEQHGVGHEPEELGEVLRPAVDQVGEGVGDGGARHRRQGRQLGVRHGLTGEGEQRDAPLDAPPAERVEAVLPGSPAAEQPDEHAGRAVEVPLDRRTTTAARPAPAGSRRAACRRPRAGRGSRCRRW